MDKRLDSLDAVFAYHEATKHRFERYARSLGHLDWATQPHPFRYYEGAERIALPLGRNPAPRDYDDLFAPDCATPLAVNLDSLADFFRYSMALSAWKQSGPGRWALRVNPSSGNLHPTEAYALLNSLETTKQPMLYHYVSETHSLERRATFTPEVWEALLPGAPPGSFVIGLTSVVWREVWKYGERAFRYCQHDVGHALAALRFSAALCGWGLKLVSHWSAEDMAALLGVDRQQDFAAGESEEPDLLALVVPNNRPTSVTRLGQPNDQMQEKLHAATWYGTANRLSPNHEDWPVVSQVSSATRMPRGIIGDIQPFATGNRIATLGPPASAEAHRIILQRRSCLALDGQSAVTRDVFLRMLARTLPGAHPPWDALHWPAAIHLALFVHRVDEITPGLYMLVRDAATKDRLRAAMNTTFSWSEVPGAPEDFPLYLLQATDCRNAARVLSCHQEIASDGFFSLGMIAEFAEPLRRRGPWFYRHLFWEAGMIGQVLYLEAEAVAARGTGIGCFFDDPVHEVLGLADNQFQSLYHFTVGISIEDQRLQTSSPYE